MRLSLNWLQEFVEVTVSPEELSDRLTLAGFEVEAVESVVPPFAGVVVGRVLTVTAHPQADRLRLAEVETGGRTFQVVCGAPNLEAGVLYPFSPPGATLAGGRVVKPAKLRGVSSEGMLLAEDDLGLSSDHTGLMAIPQDLSPGRDLAEALHLADTVLEVAVTPNRPDCLSILGLAREVAAILGRPLHLPRVEVPETGEPIQDRARVTILAPIPCPRYAARLLTGLTVGPSPFWLRRRLELAGLRSINNLVDVTNYVLLEWGQPLHAFDFERLGCGEIVVRLPHAGEKQFHTLDGQERELTPDTLLICDAVRPVALAGVMGGLDSEVTGDTRQVLIESAYFNPRQIRRTAKRLGLSTEASYRFERGVDPDGVIHALERAAQLMGRLGGGSIAAGRLDVYPTPIARPRLSLRVSRTNQVLGAAYSPEQIVGVLKALHLPVVALDDENLVLQAPSHRGDLEREADLIEEVARLAGFDGIPVTLPRGELATPRPGPLARLRRTIQELLTGLGFFEAVTYSFQADRSFRLLGEHGSGLRLANPLSEEQTVMRTSLLPGLLEALRRNVARLAGDVRLFELARCFLPQADADLPREEEWLAGVMQGRRTGDSWLGRPEPLDFYDLKGVVETLLGGLLVPEVSFRGDGLPPYLSTGARVRARQRELGLLGELAPMVLEKLDLEGPVFMFQFRVDDLLAAAQPFPLYTPLPRYPAVYLDVALVLPEDVPAARVEQALYEHGRPWLVEAQLFDAYTGPPIAPGKRSLAFRLTYRDPERTLTDEAVHGRHQRLVEALGAELGAELR